MARRVTSASYETECPLCSGRITEGDDIVLTRDQQWAHTECAEDDDENYWSDEEEDEDGE